LWLTAADAPAPDSQTAIILGVIGLLTAVLVAVVTGVFMLLSARANRTEPAPPASTPNASADLAFRDYVVGELAVNRKRDDDNDERDDLQDHELRDQREVLDEHHQRLLRLEQDRGWLQ
jgi:hypothetical protein